MKLDENLRRYVRSVETSTLEVYSSAKREVARSINNLRM